MLLFALAGCGFEYSPTRATDEVEAKLVSETAKFAGILGVQVQGKITESITDEQRQALTADTGWSWYDKGTAWYYRPGLNHVSLEPEEGKITASQLAAHETCHALANNHSLLHWQCSAKLSTPTYPRP